MAHTSFRVVCFLLLVNLHSCIGGFWPGFRTDLKSWLESTSSTSVEHLLRSRRATLEQKGAVLLEHGGFTFTSDDRAGKGHFRDPQVASTCDVHHF